MKKTVFSLIAVMLLVLATTAPASAAQTGSETATVAVTSYISGTINDIGTNGIQFGSIVAGVSDNVETEQTTAASVVGTHTGASDSATTLTDSAGTFDSTDDVYAGMIVHNTTDDSWGTVVSVDSATQITTSALANGTDNDFDASDAYIIYGGAIVFECAPENNATAYYAVKAAQNHFDSSTGPGTYEIPISNLTWDDDTTMADDASMTTSYQGVGSAITDGNEPGFTNLGLWLDIPGGQFIDSYTVSIDFKIDSSV